MESNQGVPSFGSQFEDVEGFIQKLVERYNGGEIKSWDDLKDLVNGFFTAAKMDQMEARLPGWAKMASYSGGITLVHVMCVFLGMYKLPEFLALSMHQQDLMKWVILLHDIDKFHIRGKRDTMHAFRSGVVTANNGQQAASTGFSMHAGLFQSDPTLE
jgi:hypothetical protein